VGRQGGGGSKQWRPVLGEIVWARIELAPLVACAPPWTPLRPQKQPGCRSARATCL